MVFSGGADFFRQRNRLLSPVDLEFEAALDDEAGTTVLANSDNLNLNGNANLVHVWAPSSLTATTSLGVQYEDRDLGINRMIARALVAGQGGVDDGPSPFVDREPAAGARLRRLCPGGVPGRGQPPAAHRRPARRPQQQQRRHGRILSVSQGRRAPSASRACFPAWTT